MTNRQPIEHESAKLTEQSLTEDKPSQRAQKRLATQSERDEMATFSPSPAAASPKTPRAPVKNHETL